MGRSAESSLHVTQLQMRRYAGSSTPRAKKNGGNPLARAPAIMPGKLGEGHRAKSLIGYALARKVIPVGEKFPKPEHGGLCQLDLKIAVRKGGQPGNAATRDEVQLGSNHLGTTVIRSIAALLPCSEFPRPRSCRAS